MRAAAHLHLYYPDVAVELIDRFAALGRPDIDLFATHSAPLPDAVSAALDRVPGLVERIAVPDRGFDVLPFLQVLPLARSRGAEVIAKLHTKKGRSGYAAEWRALAIDGMIASDAQVRAILDAFAADPALALVGPAALYKSAAANLFDNGALLPALAGEVMGGRYPPADWGFFAGTFFWARTDAFLTLEAIAQARGFEEAGARDGRLAHACERLFGLAPVAADGRVGLVSEDGIAIVDAPGELDDEPIVKTLVKRAERHVGALDAETVALIRADNPLAHYARHGREADALDPNPFFQSSWYNAVNADVFDAGVHPLHHYMHHGWKEARSTGPLFDAGHYRSAYGDVDGDPLMHFMTIGQREGRIGVPAAVPADGEELMRHSRRFDGRRERGFLDAMAGLDAPTIANAAATKVSVVMPVWNRAEAVAAAIRSVLAQSHAAFELIVVDDGSTDDTVRLVEPFLVDPRVVLVRAAHAGVSAARNLGLDRASGAVVAYLDSDNRWVPWFLEVMVRLLVSGGADAAYAGLALRDGRGHLAGYRGADFDWDACLASNYIDLNVFCHRRDTGERFDPALRRMVDWDFILRTTRDRPVAYAPFVGCDYSDARSDDSRITMREPAAYQKLVATKLREGGAVGSAAFAEKLRLAFAIKIAAPRAERAVWGDWHFAEALAAAIRRLGHDARIDCREEWGGHALADEDVAIVLRGLIPYAPRVGQIGVLWIISHPDQVPFDEMERFDRVYTASPSHAALLAHIVQVPVSPLLQATDPGLFRPEPRAAEAPALLFCGNSRGVRRPVIGWSISAGRNPTIYGGGWDGFVPAELIAGEALDNDVLGPLYAGAGAVLNDHWPSMRAFGIVSNRLFDVVAAGGRAITDAVPGVAGLFGDAVVEVGSPEDLRAAIDAPRVPEEEAARIAREVGEAHSFDRRAETIVADVLARLGLPPRVRPAAPRRSDPPIRVHLVTRIAAHGPQSSAYVRIVAPLTDPGVADRVSLTLGGDGEVPTCDVCIVQRTALPDRDAVDALVGRLGRQGAALVTDVDDAFAAIGNDHPEAAFYRPLNAALERAMAAAAESWFSTPALARLYAGTGGSAVVIPNGLDPRLWRDWRRAPDELFGDRRLRLLYMGTHTHAADFARLRPALQRLAEERPDAFRLTLVGIETGTAPAPWLDSLAPPAEAVSYPRFVRWLRGQGPFDAGLAPLAPSAFNDGKSDVKLLDYAALGLLPVVEDCAAYRADPRFADAALFAHDWYEAMAALLDHPERWRARARRASALLWRHRDAAAVGRRMLDRLEALVRRPGR
ncbi:glycosyltransferase [Sphingomonas sp.]|uniref:glycosyltransferase n=1 Tax=Sphingomonas sp. TaxID=28214 RepID=UPI003B005679